MKEELYRFSLVVFMVCGLCVLADTTAQGGETPAKERLAVLNLEAKYGIDKELGLAEALSVIVRDTLHGFGDFQVMSKEDIQAVASREQLLQAMGCNDGGNQCLVDIGRALGTRFMVAGDISKLGSTYTISLRMIDTAGETAGVTNRASESCKCNEDALITTAKDVAARLVGKSIISAPKGEEETKRLAAEKKKAIDTEKKRQAVLAEERRKADEEKLQLTAELEKLKKERAKGEAEEKAKKRELDRQHLAETSEEKSRPEADTAKLSAEAVLRGKVKENGLLMEKSPQTEVDKRYILGKMEQYDRQQLNNVYEYLRSGSTAQWRNQTTNTDYEATPQPAFSLADQPAMPCRKAEIIATTGKNAVRTTATACRNNEAQWIFQN